EAWVEIRRGIEQSPQQAFRIAKRQGIQPVHFRDVVQQIAIHEEPRTSHKKISQSVGAGKGIELNLSGRRSHGSRFPVTRLWRKPHQSRLERRTRDDWVL